MRIELSGTEVYTIECVGSLPRAAARRLLPDALGLPDDGDAEVGLLCFAMRSLGASEPVRVGPRFDYCEALWRIGVTWRGAPAWFAVACDLDSAFVRTLGAILVRYPVRSAEIVVDDEHATIRAGGVGFEVRARALEHAPDPIAPRPILVGSGASLYRIPWREDPAPHRRDAEVTIVDDALERTTLGSAVRWQPHGLVHRGRIHRCGIASRVATSS